MVGSEECAIKAVYLLTDKYRNVAEKRKEDVIRLIFEDTEKYKDDQCIYFFGFNFVLKLNWKELYVPFIRKFDEKLRFEFDEDYIRFYELKQYVQNDV